MRHIFVIVMAALLAFGGVAVAKEAGSKGKTFTIGKLTKQQRSTLIESASTPKLFQRNVGRAIPQFKLPAYVKIECVISATGIECEPNYNRGTCPKEIEVNIPGQQTPTNLPVDCVGPDANGECECEVAGN